MADRQTPLRAIRRRCLDCSGYSAAEVRDCDFTDCALFTYRMGKRPRPPAELTPCRAIRTYCLWCRGGSAVEVKLCPKADCGPHDYRLGRNPARKGVRHAGSFKSAPQLAIPGLETKGKQ